VYAKALCFLLEALGGSEKSRLDIGGGSDKSRFATAGTRNDVPLPSHTLSLRLVFLAHNQIINKIDVFFRSSTAWPATADRSVNSTSFSELLKQPVDATLFHPLSGSSASNLLALYPFDRCKLLINIFSSSLNVIVYTYCSDV